MTKTEADIIRQCLVSRNGTYTIGKDIPGLRRLWKTARNLEHLGLGTIERVGETDELYQFRIWDGVYRF